MEQYYYKSFIIDRKSLLIKLEQRTQLNTAEHLENVKRVVIATGKDSKIYDICIEMFDKNLFDESDPNFYYCSNIGMYIWIYGDDKLLPFVLNYIQRHELVQIYPLIPNLYNLHNHRYDFRQICNNPLTFQTRKKFKYSFGIEFETSSGIIPEDKCFELGLIPLRDGSIGGSEYTTIPMTLHNLDLLKRQVKILRQYTKFDSSCSMHIHFGNYPQDIKYLYCLYYVFYRLQNDFAAIMPKYTFHTERYKRNHKSYCGLLPKFSTFKSWYDFMYESETDSEVHDYTDLTIPHPNDPEGRSKWRIDSRYFALNFINAMFYNHSKTVEFRFLKPSYNFVYICNWIAIFTFILDHAEKLYIAAKDIDVLDLSFTLFDSANCPNMIHNLVVIADYPTNIRQSALFFIDNLCKVTRLQANVHDHIGLTSFFHDYYFKTNIFPNE